MSDLYCHNCQHEGPFGRSLTGPYCLRCGGLNIWPKNPPPGPRAVPRGGTNPLWKAATVTDPCPRCGSKTEVRLQTPVVDGIVSEAFFRCFACDLRSPNFPDWEPVAYPVHGKRPIEPLRAFWNEWAAAWMGDNDREQLEGFNCSAGFCGGLKGETQ